MDEQAKARIVEQVVQRIGQDAPAVLSQRGQSVGGRGVHPTVDAAVAAAKRTFLDLQDISLSERARYIAALRQVTLNSLEEMARFAVEETGLGRVSDKIEKNRLVAEKTPGIESLQPVSQTGDHGLTLTEWAPYGEIGSITPCTNPPETILNKGIGMLASGNTVVFNTHPNAKRLSAWYIDPEWRHRELWWALHDLQLCCDADLETAGALMKHPDIRLLVVTGGACQSGHGQWQESHRSGSR